MAICFLLQSICIVLQTLQVEVKVLSHLPISSAQIIFDFALELQEGILIVSWDNSSSGGSLKPLQSLSTLKPRRVVPTKVSELRGYEGKNKPCKPSLWDSVSPILNYVAVVADEEECATIGKIELHSYKTIGVSWKVMKGDSLTEINCAIIESLPIQRELHAEVSISILLHFYQVAIISALTSK